MWNNFDTLYRKVYDRVKFIELSVAALQDRLDAEDKFNKQLEKNQMPDSYGDFQIMIDALKVDLSTRITYNKVANQMQYYTSMQAELETVSQQTKIIHQQLKPMKNEIENSDKELKHSWDKLVKAKDRYFKAMKEQEDCVLAMQALEWNREATAEQKDKQLTKFQNIGIKEAEISYQSSIDQYNGTLLRVEQLINSHQTLLKGIYDKEFSLFKELSQRQVINEISRQRNIQYDSENYFKEIEKLHQKEKYFDTNSNLQNLLNLTKIKYQKAEFSQYITCLTPSINGILQRYFKNNLPSSSQQEEDDQDSIYSNPKIMSGFNEMCFDMIKIAHNKYETEVEVEEESQKQSLDPLSKPRTSISKKKQSPIQYFYLQNSAINPDRLQNLMGLAKFVIEASANDPLIQFKDIKISPEEFKGMMQKKRDRDLAIQLIEMFRTTNCTAISKVGYKKLVNVVEMILDNLEYNLDQIKRLLVMLFTIYKMNDGQKQFIADGVLLHELWRKQELWSGLIFKQIEDELGRQDQQKSSKLDKELILRDKNIVYNSILGISANMINFDLDKGLMKQLVQKNSKMYGLFEYQISELLSFIEKNGNMDDRKISSTAVLSTLYSEKPQKKVSNIAQ